MPKFTTIQITPEAREKLKELGKKGDSYEDIILRLIEQNKAKKP
ncbi:MAG TPA: antitoxin VapB family protein [archaeon]|nr:antitoxin VapB family protein [archaeon]